MGSPPAPQGAPPAAAPPIAARSHLLYSLIPLALVLVYLYHALRTTQVTQGWQPHLLLDFAWSADGPRMPAPPVAIIGVFLNEGSNLREWLEHYAEQGIEHFVLLDNGSSDGWQAEVAGFEGAIKVFSSTLKHAQVQMYNTLAVPWLQSQGIDIALVADLDEFAFSTLPGKHLAHLAWGIFNHSDSSMISSLLMAWKLFGSSGHVEQPESVREGFTLRKAATGFSGLGKSFVRISRVKEVGIHASDSATGVRVDEPFSTTLGFQLNHYTIQSRRWFEAVKMTRGDVGTASLDNIRNWDYYARYDHSEHNDTALQQLARAWRRDHPECYPPRKKLYHTPVAKAAAP